MSSCLRWSERICRTKYMLNQMMAGMLRTEALLNRCTSGVAQTPAWEVGTGAESNRLAEKERERERERGKESERETTQNIYL